MTLGELAKKLRELFWFRWLTLDYTGYITLWNMRPKFGAVCPKDKKEMWHRGDDPLCGICAYIFPYAINEELDLREYTREISGVDYSKCIVEVRE